MEVVIRDAVSILKEEFKKLNKDARDLTSEEVCFLAAHCNGRLSPFGPTRIVTFAFDQKAICIVVHAIVDGQPKEIAFDLQRIAENVSDL